MKSLPRNCWGSRRLRWRRAVRHFGVCLGVGGAVGVGVLAPTATASRLLRNTDGSWRHGGDAQNTFVLNIGATVPPWLAAEVRIAAMEWGSDVGPIIVAESEDPQDSSVNVYVGAAPGVSPGQCEYERVACSYVTPKSSVIKFNLSAFKANKLSLKLNGFYQGIACHEIGHVLGLDHGGQGCMRLDERPLERSLLHLLLRHNLFDVVASPLHYGFELSGSKPGYDDVRLLDQAYKRGNG